MSDPEEGTGGFLSGWSRRKLAAKRKEAAPPPADEEPEALPELELADAAPEEVEDAELIAALPSLDDITAGFDIKPFLAKGVPAKLKNAAMRKLWLASPSVRDYVDPAVDYAWDWNAPGGVPGGGGILSEQSVAKMVKDLIGGSSKPEEAQAGEELAQDATAQDFAQDATAQDFAQETPPDSDDAAQDIPDAPSEPVRRTTKTEQPEMDAVRQATQRGVQAPAPRRHGGAAPE
jgi:hypothetical protein